MKKLIYIFLFLFITAYIIWALHFFGILHLDDMIVNTPYIKERLKTDAQYDRMMEDYYSLENANDDLRAENEELKQRITELENQVSQKDERITNLESEFKDYRATQEDDQKRVEKLVDIYSNMEPDAAARLITDLQMETTVQIIKDLDDEQVAEIISNLPQEIAISLTERLRE